MHRYKKLFYYSFPLAIIFLGCKPGNVLLHPEDKAFTKQAPANFKVVLETTRGEVVMQVKRAWAPAL